MCRTDDTRAEELRRRIAEWVGNISITQTEDMAMADEKGNTGNLNTGDWNTGDWNTGNLNTGNRNTGDLNTGDRNTGDLNTGDWNTGDLNTGDRNTGDLNTGDWNTGDWNTGFFCVDTPCVSFFDQPTTLTFDEAYALIPFVELPISCEWFPTSKMTDEEKVAAPSHAITGGFLSETKKAIQEVFPVAWKALDIATKQRFHSLPNFDADKFLKCTGVDVRLDTDLYPVSQESVKRDENEIVLNGKRYRLVPVD